MCDYQLRTFIHSELSIYEGERIHVVFSGYRLHPCVYSHHNMAADTYTLYIGM